MREKTILEKPYPQPSMAIPMCVGQAMFTPSVRMVTSMHMVATMLTSCKKVSGFSDIISQERTHWTPLQAPQV